MGGFNLVIYNIMDLRTAIEMSIDEFVKKLIIINKREL